jgi:cellulose synthase/poly-beta-1,6-N-acetylglucosamine synthase-like glycosyltransferase/putative flippase GtrA
MKVLRDWFCRLPQKLQFVLAGGSGWILGLVVLRVLIGGYGWPVKAATAMMLVITFAYTFVLNRFCTWRHRRVGRLCLIKFVASRAVVAYVTWVAVAWLTGRHFLLPVPVHAIYVMGYLEANTLCVGLATIINWIGGDKWVFTPRLLPVGAVSTGRHAFGARQGLSPPQRERRRRHNHLSPIRHAYPQDVARGRVVGRARVAFGRVLPQWPKARVRRVRRLPARVRLVVGAVVLTAVAGVVVYALWHDVRGTVIGIVAIYTLPMLVIGVRTLALTAHYWRTPWDADASRDRLDTYEAPLYTFDVIVPARHEAGVLYRNIKRIMQLDYPWDMFCIWVAVADDDLDTLAEARRAEREFANLRVVVVAGDKHSKPISLNAVLPFLRNDITFPLDAESCPAPKLLLHVNTLIRRHPEVGAWQGGVQLMNIWAPRRARQDGRPYQRWDPRGWRWGSAWRGQNCLEYRVWFKSRMQYQAGRGFITLGGNTVFVWTHLLKQIGGWRDMVTEDCDLGVRLSVMGIPIRAFYLGNLVTREETPVSLRAHNVQRRRWILGFFQVKGLGEWRQIPSPRRRLLAYELLSLPFWQAVSGIMTPVSFATAVFFKAPVLVVLWTYTPAALAAVYAVVLWQAFRDFCQEFHLPVTRLYMLRFLLFLPIYQVALAVAAMRALKRYIVGDYAWGKTEHTGRHLEEGRPFEHVVREPVTAL